MIPSRRSSSPSDTTSGGDDDRDCLRIMRKTSGRDPPPTRAQQPRAALSRAPHYGVNEELLITPTTSQSPAAPTPCSAPTPPPSSTKPAAATPAPSTTSPSTPSPRHSPATTPTSTRKPPGPRSPKPAQTDPDRHYAEQPATEPTKAPPTTPGRGHLTPQSSATPMTASSARSTTDNNPYRVVWVRKAATASVSPGTA
jgi:hypothetical protein